MITPDEFSRRMKDIVAVNEGDREDCHRAMDDLMRAVLRELGYGDGIDVFEHTPKWYA